MRSRDRILRSLESTFRDAFRQAEARGDGTQMERLDLEYQVEQLRLEVLLDLRELLEGAQPAPPPAEEPSLLREGSALLEKAEALKRMTRLR